jgi:long-subunit acyl-CoA synthetase (AMP-forming)
VYSECPSVSQIFVAADSLQSYVVAVVVPSEVAVKSWAETAKFTVGRKRTVSREEDCNGLCREREKRSARTPTSARMF